MMRQAISRLKFNQKISIVVALLIICSNIFVLLLTSASAIRSLQRKSGKLAEGQVVSVGSVLDSIFGNLMRVMNNSIADAGVQNYVTYELGNDVSSLQNTNDAYVAISRLKDSSELIDYVAIIHFERDLVLYIGEVWKNNDFREKILADFYGAAELSETNIRVGLMEKVFNPEENVINFYCPMNEKYDFRPNQEVAFLVVGIGENKIAQYMASSREEFSLNLFLTDQSGMILYHEDHQKIGSQYLLTDQITNAGGSYSSDDEMVLYQRVKSCDWYTVGTILTKELLKDTRSTMYSLTIFIMVACVAGIWICYYLSKNLYKPMGEIIDKMEKVAAGDLNTQMDTNYQGEDFKQLADGFNTMTEHIRMLMEQVKAEQHELEQSKLNALQSQIKPHFLYNTLECIHWQALSEGNMEVSRMVKALANYYRLCLSKGQDIITLSKELAHTRNYLIIQNMRYDDIAEAKILVEEYFDDVLIPKMTLQPLVENAIYHGIKVKDGYRGTITIDAKEAKDAVVVSISDTGKGMTKEQIDDLNQTLSEVGKENGYGVRNVHKRIEILFGKGYGLHYRSNELEGITVEIRLPKGSVS